MMFFLALLLCLLASSYSQECGQRGSMARIIGGEEAAPHSWPWQLSLRLWDQHVCGASLVNRDWVVIAAHCFKFSPNAADYTIVAGAHSRTNDGEVYQVERFIIHPDYKEGVSSIPDVAVLKLSRAVTLNDHVKTICLPAHGSRVQLGTQCFVTGWGRIDPNDEQLLADRLKQARAPLASHSDCQRVNRPYGVDERSMLCVGGQGSNVCNGDSGGPLSCLENNRWVLRGAASWVTHKTCPTNTYGVYARVSSYMNWINGHIGGGGGGGGGNSNCQDIWRTQDCLDYIGSCTVNPQMRASCRKTCGVC